MNDFSFKELEQCYLKATYPIEIGDKLIEAKEVLAKFDSIQVAGLDEVKQYITANGGFDNRPHVFWETTKELDLTFSQGVFSKQQFSLMTNSKLFELDKNDEVLITETETKETDENGIFQLKETPVDLFIYDESGVKVAPIEKNGKEIKLDSPYKSVVAQYTYNYQNNSQLVKIGQQLFNGFVELEGRTRVKDDITGQVITGIIKIPKLKLLTNLSMRLGSQATPLVGTFKGAGVPVGGRGSSHVCEFYFLSNNLDSDF